MMNSVILGMKSCNLPLILCKQVVWVHGGGSQIWIGQGCAVGSSKPILMFRGNFSKNRPLSYFGIFSKKGTHFLRFCHRSTPNLQNFLGFARKILKIRPIVTFFFHEKWNPCLWICCKNGSIFAAHSLIS